MTMTAPPAIAPLEALPEGSGAAQMSPLSRGMRTMAAGVLGTTGSLGAAWLALADRAGSSVLVSFQALITSPAAAAAAATGLVLAALCRSALRNATAPATVSDAPTSAGNSPLLNQVMPVWRTQLDAARTHADASANNLLEAFGEIDNRLDQAIRITEAAQSDVSTTSVDDLVRENEEALNQLIAPMRAALETRDHVMEALNKVTTEAAALREIALQVRQLAKRTSMVALNASVEASRAGERGSGFATVAQEVRQLALQSGEAGASMLSLTSRLEARLQALNNEAAVQDSSDEALRAEADASARAAISGLLRSMSEVSRSTRGLREAGQAVREQVERTLIGFQSQDRLNQMLGSIVDDIERMHQWIEQGGDLSRAQAIAWLERLESSYTMEEQRTVHHGQSAIERSSSVDFF